MTSTISKHNACRTWRTLVAGVLTSSVLIMTGCGGGGGGSSSDTTATDPRITVNKTAIDFGSTVVGQTVPGSVTVSNSGNTSLTVNAALSGTGVAAFGPVTPNGCNNLAPGSDCTIDLAFDPVDSGSFTASLTVSASGATSRTVALSGVAQDLNVQITSVGCSSTNPLPASVRVTDSLSNPVVGILEQYFNSYLSGGAVPSGTDVTGGGIERKPIALMLAVDWSGSTEGIRPAIVDATKLFIDSLEATDRVGVLRFARDMELDEDYTATDYRLPLADATRKQNMKDKLDAAFDQGTLASSIWTAVQTSRRAVDQEDEAAYTRVVILLSDGVDNGSTDSLDDVIARAQAANTLVYTVGFEGSTGFNLEDLRKLSDGTGGLAFQSVDASDLSQFYLSIAESLTGFYNLLIQNPTTNATSLRVVVDTGADSGEDSRPVSACPAP